MSYFTLPGVIVYFLAIYCLGPVSTFYKSSVVEGLRADEELCRMVCSAVSLSHSFRSVADKEGQLTHERVLAEVAPRRSRASMCGLRRFCQRQWGSRPSSPGGAAMAYESGAQNPGCLLHSSNEARMPEKVFRRHRSHCPWVALDARRWRSPATTWRQAHSCGWGHPAKEQGQRRQPTRQPTRQPPQANKRIPTQGQRQQAQARPASARRLVSSLAGVSKGGLRRLCAPDEAQDSRRLREASEPARG